jgi:WD40 repeat protein
MLSGSNDATVRCWNVEDGQQLFELRGHRDGVRCVAFSNDETRAISGSSDKTLKVWDLINGREIVTLEGHQHGIRALALFHHNDIVVTGDESGHLIYWDLNKGKELRRFDRFRDLAKLQSSTKDLWEVARGPEWQPSSEERHAPCIESLAISPDDRWLIVAQRDRPVSVWDMEMETAILELRGHTGIVFGVAVTSDGRRAISASDDNSLRAWDLETGVCVATFTADSPLYCCAVCPESHTILAGEGARSGKVQFLTLVEEARRYGR